MKKINIKINEWTYTKLKNLDDASIDKNLNLLMDTIEKQMPLINYGEKTKTVNAYEDTCRRLDSFKLTLGESRDNVITRMLLLFDEIDNFGQELWIPFKLTSRLNKKLTINAQIEYHSHEMMFYEGNDIYGWNLPSTYTVNGENLTVEFKSWISLLDWAEIKTLVLDHYDESVKFNRESYYLDINI